VFFLNIYKREKYFLAITITVLIAMFSGVFYDSYINGRLSYGIQTFLVKEGSRGQDVKDVQYILRKWGYFDGPIDGIFGPATKEAVIRFQKKNGLKADGIVGDETGAALGINVAAKNKEAARKSAPASKGAVSRNNEVYLLAQAIHGEARGEPYIGQVAVGAVILNRVDDPRFPKTIAGVIYQPGAFTAVADGQINLAPGETALKAARDALNGWDPSGGAMYYYNPAKATSKWIWSRPIIKVIGKHYFCM
jgi:N-acetylmuramoyl-L-alanine amidase